MTITAKVWGTTECCLPEPNCEVHRLIIKPHHRCSLHRHHAKANFFYVLSGHLYVDVGRTDGGGLDAIRLGANESMTVPAGVIHQFRTGSEPCEALEMYYHEALAEDIERVNEGGPVRDGDEWANRSVAHHRV